MLKQRMINLAGRDAGVTLTLQELPAMAADRLARSILKRIGVETTGSIATLALKHAKEAIRLDGSPVLGFVRGSLHSPLGAREIDLTRDIRDWRNVERIQHAALALHIDFIIGRESVEIPVSLTAHHIFHAGADTAVTFCSQQIAAVLESKLASYVELETVLSTEDVFNMAEILNVAAIREWHAHQAQQKAQQ